MAVVAVVGGVVVVCVIFSDSRLSGLVGASAEVSATCAAF